MLLTGANMPLLPPYAHFLPKEEARKICHIAFLVDSGLGADTFLIGCPAYLGPPRCD